jgi:hypothetical protein
MVNNCRRQLYLVKLKKLSVKFMLNLNLLGFIKVKFCVNLSYFFEMIEIIADILVNTLAVSWQKHSRLTYFTAVVTI